MLQQMMHAFNFFSVAWVIFILFGLSFTLVFNIRVSMNTLKYFYIISIIGISIFAFNYNPTELTDLFRYYETLDYMRSSGAPFYNKTEVIMVFLFNIVAHTPYNQLLPFIVAAIRYTLFFLIVWKYTQKFKEGGFQTRLFIFTQFAFLPLVESISGIRYYFAINVLFYLIIYDFYFQKRWISRVGLIIPIFIHTSSGMFILLRILALEFIYKWFKYLKYLLLLWTLFTHEISLLLLKTGNEYAIVAAQMLSFYSEEDRTISLRLTLVRLSFVALIYCMYITIKQKENKMFKQSLSYYRYVEMIILFTIGSLMHAVFFQRNIFFLVLICMPLFFDFFKGSAISSEVKKVIIFMLLILSVGMFANQFYGLVSGYF